MAKAPSYDINHPSLAYLSFRGPHRVSSGRSDEAGLPGVVIAPAFGRDLPVVALAHGWMQPAVRYAGTMRFLASWGFVVIAPDTARGPISSHGRFALDVQSALDLVVSGRLAGGKVRVDGTRLGVIGHSIGGGAAVLAAAANKDIKAVVTVTAAETAPSAVAAAARATMPGLHLVGSGDNFAGSGSDSAGAEIAAAWAGPSQLRTIKGASHLGLAEDKHWTTQFTGSGDEKKVQQVVRTLATAFLMRHLTGSDQLIDELEAKFAGTTLEDLTASSS